jgi:beta-glucosidase
MQSGRENSDAHDVAEQQIDELLSKMTLREKVALLSGADAWRTVPIERLGIPAVTVSDGPHGVRANRVEAGRLSGLTTAFPTGVSMAASWNTELIERVGAALGKETHAMGCDVLLGPCVNIVRHPLAGRNFEAYSEDPYLAGRIGTAWVKGVQSEGVGASLKHFACNNQEIERGRGNSVVDERSLREIYLAQFETVVKEADPWTVMCSYNRINGDYASQNHHLLKEILKGEWGYRGAVISDWGANHTIVDSVQNGLDLEMPGPAKYYGNLLAEAVQNWQIDESAVDDAARRMLRMIVRSGRMGGKVAAGAANTPAHQGLARELAEEAITLLKNDGNLLPIIPGQVHTIAVIGPNAASAPISGGGSSQVEPPTRSMPLAALQAALAGRAEVRYEQGCENLVDLPLVNMNLLSTGDAHGLKGEYFANPTLDGQPDVTRVDTLADYWWYGSGPAEGISIERFAARWTGTLTVPETGQYTFKLTNTASACLSLDGKALIDHRRSAEAMADHPSIVSTAQIDLTAGQPYALKVEFVKTSSENMANVRLQMARTYRPGEDDRQARAVALAKQADVVIFFGGMPEGYETEGADRPNMDLPGAQNELIGALVQANRRTIVVLNAGAPVAGRGTRRGGSLLPRHGRRRGHRQRAAGRGEPLRQAAGHLPQAPGGYARFQQLSWDEERAVWGGHLRRLPALRPARHRAAVPLRARPVVHHLWIRRTASPGAGTHRRNGARLAHTEEHRHARGQGSGTDLRARRAIVVAAPAQRAKGVRQSGACRGRIEDGELRAGCPGILVLRSRPPAVGDRARQVRIAGRQFLARHPRPRNAHADRLKTHTK